MTNTHKHEAKMLPNIGVGAIAEVIDGGIRYSRCIDVADDFWPGELKNVRDAALKMFREKDSSRVKRFMKGEARFCGYYVLDNHLWELIDFLNDPQTKPMAEMAARASASYGAGKRDGLKSRWNTGLAVTIGGEKLELSVESLSAIQELIGQLEAENIASAAKTTELDLQVSDLIDQNEKLTQANNSMARVINRQAFATTSIAAPKLRVRVKAGRQLAA